MDGNIQNEIENIFYKYENHKDVPKDYFKLIVNDFKKIVKERKHCNILDIGCASGDFLYYVEGELKKLGIIEYELNGMDIWDDLLEEAKIKIPTSNFFLGDISQEKGNGQYDVVTVMGVTYLYEDIFNIIDNAVTYLKDDGVAYIFERFNKYGFNIALKYEEDDRNKRRGNIHIHSLNKIMKHYEGSDLNISYIPFEIHTPIEKTNDTYRTWTVGLDNGSLAIINGLNMWNEYFAIRVTKCVRSKQGDEK